MSKHTPGPWSVGEVSHKKQRVDIDSRSYDEFMDNQRWTGLARTYGCEDYPEKGSEAMMANARLIAAAPELLEALRGMLALDEEHHQRGHCDDDVCAEVRKARAAIAKAKGEQS